MKTFIIDIDGCILKRSKEVYENAKLSPTALPGSREKIIEWERQGHMIILLTSRRESFRSVTQRQLEIWRIPYDLLIMGANQGERILINDKKPDSDQRVATAIEIERNKGLCLVEV